MALADSFAGAATSSKIVASGETGKEILGYLIETMDQAEDIKLEEWYFKDLNF